MIITITKQDYDQAIKIAKGDIGVAFISNRDCFLATAIKRQLDCQSVNVGAMECDIDNDTYEIVNYNSVIALKHSPKILPLEVELK